MFILYNESCQFGGTFHFIVHYDFILYICCVIDLPESQLPDTNRKLAYSLIYSSLALVFVGLGMRFLHIIPDIRPAVMGGGVIVYIIGYSILFWAPKNQAKLRAMSSTIPVIALIKLCIYSVYVGVNTTCIGLFIGIYHIRQWRYVLSTGVLLMAVAFIVLAGLGSWAKRQRQ